MVIMNVLIIWTMILKGQFTLRIKTNVMLKTIANMSTIIITKYTWYHRYSEIIQITGGLPLRLHRKPDSKARKSNLKYSDGTSAISILTRIIVFRGCYYLSHLNHLPLVRFLLAQTDMVVCHSSRNFNNVGSCVMFWKHSLLALVHMLLHGLYRLQVNRMRWSDVSI